MYRGEVVGEAADRSEPRWVGRRAHSRRALKPADRTLDFILSEVGSHQKVLSRGLAQYDTYLNFISQFLWLVHRTMINFCILTTYPAISLDSLLTSSGIWIDYLELGLLQTRSFPFFLSVQTSCLLFLLAAFLNYFISIFGCAGSSLL